MRLKTYLTIGFVVLNLFITATAQDSDELFTIYLVRHAEKEISAENPRNPPLTECGQQRAESLAAFLKDVNLDAIYSTDFIRTKSTAQPTVRLKEIELTLYDSRKLADFAALLIERKEDALVVGHSNTTGVLAGLLVGKDIKAFGESIYNRIYQVVMYKDKGHLQVFHTAVICTN